MADDQNDIDNLDITDEDAAKLLNDPAEDAKPAKPDEPAQDSDQLGEAGKRAIEAMKRERNAARKEAAEARAKAKQYEDANKTESERLQEALAAHQSRAEKAEAALKRREVAESRAPEHATVAQIKAVAKRLAGETDDELEADADELFALLAPAPEPKPAKTPSRPTERLRGGGDPDEEPQETDPRKLAALIPRRR